MKLKGHVIAVCVIAALLTALVPDYRFGPDFRLSSKILDPKDTKFDKESFDYNDYNDYEDLVFVLKNIFPEGTDKAYVVGKFKNSFGGLSPISSQEHDNKSLKDASRNYIQESELVLDFARLYPLRTCFWSAKRKTDKLIFVFDEKQKLKNLYARFSCTIALGRS